MSDVLATARAVHERTGQFVCAIFSRSPAPFTFETRGGVQAQCFHAADRDLIVIEDGRRFDAAGEEITE